MGTSWFGTFSGWLGGSQAFQLPAGIEYQWFITLAGLALLATCLAYAPLVRLLLCYSTSEGERWNPARWVGSGLIHTGILHLAGNLFLLFTMLPFLRSLIPVSDWAFCSLALQMAICGFRSCFRTLFEDGAVNRSVGASGWILAWVGFMSVTGPQNLQLSLFYLVTLPIRDAVILGFLGSLFCASFFGSERVDHEGHAFGLLVGAAWGFLKGGL